MLTHKRGQNKYFDCCKFTIFFSFGTAPPPKRYYFFLAIFGVLLAAVVVILINDCKRWE